MWNVLLGFLLARATGAGRLIRVLLMLTLLGSIAAGVIYALAVIHAVEERGRANGHNRSHRI